MKTVSKALLSVLFVLVAFSGCTHKGYDEVEDVGEWRSLGHMERDEYYRSNPASRCVFRFVKHSDSISIDMLKYYEPIWPNEKLKISI